MSIIDNATSETFATYKMIKSFEIIFSKQATDFSRNKGDKAMKIEILIKRILCLISTIFYVSAIPFWIITYVIYLNDPIPKEFLAAGIFANLGIWVITVLVGTIVIEADKAHWFTEALSLNDMKRDKRYKFELILFYIAKNFYAITFFTAFFFVFDRNFFQLIPFPTDRSFNLFLTLWTLNIFNCFLAYASYREWRALIKPITEESKEEQI